VTVRNAKRTRKGLIDGFKKRKGFAIIIMSPVAAGTGLAITEANHVIHLERHRNPAKEAQKTDRVYRIGKNRSEEGCKGLSPNSRLSDNGFLR
jgi:SNF2 family DNA or RNA helicase